MNAEMQTRSRSPDEMFPEEWGPSPAASASPAASPVVRAVLRPSCKSSAPAPAAPPALSIEKDLEDLTWEKMEIEYAEYEAAGDEKARSPSPASSAASLCWFAGDGNDPIEVEPAEECTGEAVRSSWRSSWRRRKKLIQEPATKEVESEDVDEGPPGIAWEYFKKLCIMNPRAYSSIDRIHKFL